jgi:hypothetical protein
MSIKKHLWKALQKVNQTLGADVYDLLSITMQSTPDYIMIGRLSQSGTDAPVVNVFYTNFSSPLEFRYSAPGVYRAIHPLFSDRHVTLFTGSDSGNNLSYSSKNTIFQLSNITMDGIGIDLDKTISFKLEIHVDPEHYITK